MKLHVNYTVEYTAVIDVPENPTAQNITDAIFDVDIPENPASTYRHSSFHVLSTALFDKRGERVNLP
jgi:hypothetical protein